MNIFNVILYLLKLYNILNSKKTLIMDTKKNDKVRIFLCGPTSCQNLHFGHARFFFVFDLIARLLKFYKIQTIIIVNISDLDPKLFSKAKDNRIDPHLFVERNIIDFLELTKQLNFNEGMIFAKVSDFIPQMINIIQSFLFEKDAYQSFGNIYLDKGKKIENLTKKVKKEISSTRFDIGLGKKNSHDILLWNGADAVDYFYSGGGNLGNGIPWWHIQDVSVISSLFGGKYDIHGGGSDLIIPHHENINSILFKLNKNFRYPRFWIHIGLVYYKKKKMSKSANTGIKIKELLKKYNINTLKLYSYSKHYRSSMSFNERELKDYQKLDCKIQEYIINFEHSLVDTKKEKSFFNRFLNCLNDDLNTMEAIELLKESLNERDLYKDISKMVKILGLKYKTL
jgi:cysteinyl-tRNA synthetase